MSEVKNVNQDTWEKEVIQSELPVLVDFWAPWCGPCKLLGPTIDVLASENAGKINVVKVNVDDNKALAVQFGIRGVPTLAFFKGGSEVKRIVGGQGKSQLQLTINEIIK
jgi:thioredoxin 1